MGLYINKVKNFFQKDEYRYLYCYKNKIEKRRILRSVFCLKKFKYNKKVFHVLRKLTFRNLRGRIKNMYYVKANF